MMVLLQRTQQLDVNEWRELREQAYERFGKDLYKRLLQIRDEETPVLLKGSIPSFDRKRIMFGAMKEERGAQTPEWVSQLPEVYEALRSKGDPTETLSKLLRRSDDDMKMRHIRRTTGKNEEDWNQAYRQMEADREDDGFKRYNLQHEVKERWERLEESIYERTIKALEVDPIREGVKLIPDLLAQWN
jgi:hypothetical protein